MDNPYAPPVTETTKEQPGHPTRPPLSRGEVAGRFAVAGFLGGCALGTVGYLLLIGVIEFLLTPPFKSPPNYGQFGIIVVGVGFYMSMFGLCLSVVPYASWIGYIPIHALGLCSIWMIDGQLFAEVDWSEAPIAAMMGLFLLPTPVALAFNLWSRRLQSTAVRN